MKHTIPYSYKINPIVLIFGSFFLVVIPFLIWSSWAELDQISHAQGQVMATAKTQTIQAPIDGIVGNILVKEGQKVMAKEQLLSLEKDKGKAAYDDSKSKVAALRVAVIRLQAEVYGKELVFPRDLVQEYPEFVANQKELFKKRQKALHDETSALKESLALVEEELKNTIPLLKTGDIGSSEIIRLKKQVSDIKGQIANKINKYFQDSQSEMTKIEEELSSKEQEFTDRKINLEWTDIYSPMNAIVKNILITTKGARVRSGDVIMELVPFGDALLIEAKLPPSDISFVKKGQRAAVKLDAYDYSIYGIFDGEVVYISPDTLTEKTAQGDKFYFKVHIKLDQTKLMTKSGKEIEVSPGMTAKVDIITGSRTVLRYLTKPITKTLSEAFHEK